MGSAGAHSLIRSLFFFYRNFFKLFRAPIEIWCRCLLLRSNLIISRDPLDCDLISFFFFFLFILFSFFFIFSFIFPLPFCVVRGLTVLFSSDLPATYGGSPPLPLCILNEFSGGARVKSTTLQHLHHGLL